MRSTLRLLGIVSLWSSVCAFLPLEPAVPGRPDPHLLIRNDGKFVQNVGQLQLQISNYGVTGAPAYGMFSNVPGAEWPPGSGKDYLYAAGLWVGALDATGIPHVSTAIGFSRADFELAPTFRPRSPCDPLPPERIADVRETYEGAPGGNRVISANVNADDDGDGLIDEDFLNGEDDDGDGRCDEDYSAIGQQMLASEYVDDTDQVRASSPEHVPLGIKIQQTSYAWSTPGQSDFVGMDYKIINRSGRALRNVYIAIFADMDIGSRAECPDCYYKDDEAALFDSTVSYVGATGGLVKRRIQMGYMWDNPDDPARVADAKGGDAPGFFGCMFLNHTTDPSGVLAPRRVGITAFKYFYGEASFPAGGDPRNDAQRYLLMSDPLLSPDIVGQVRSARPLDYRFIMATGPFRSILPDSSLTISVAWVMGLGRGPALSGGTLVDNAIRAQQVFDGLYADLDGNVLTGSCGKETCLKNTQIGGRGFTYSIPESSLCRLRFHTDVNTVPQFSDVTPWFPDAPCQYQQGGRFVCPDVLAGTIPDGAHCASEDTLAIQIVAPTCTYVDFDCDVNTGQAGREHLVNWVAAAPLPAPFYAGESGQGEVSDYLSSARTSAWYFPGDRKVTLKWNNFGELVRDAQHGNFKGFLGYRIYRAAGWVRPLGTNAPSRDLWALLGEWRLNPKGTSARPLSELIDPSIPIVNTNTIRVVWDPNRREVRDDSSHTEIDTLFAVGRYSYVDAHVLNGFPYFYAIVPVSLVPGPTEEEDAILQGNPSASNAQVVYPRGSSVNDQKHVFVVPNPYKGGAEWDLIQREEDPSGTKITFMNLPRTKGTIHIFTLAGDLVKDVPFDGKPPVDLQYGKDPVTEGRGSVPWNLISRNGQKIVSGVYLFSVDTELGHDIGRFVVVR
ncbi:MAG TPA: hypothetical protein VER38_05035 [Candidatus Eisenbacteria bacterium]|nr:hypothetical protein [Candidatus Eisenbacteria bacterium]